MAKLARQWRSCSASALRAVEAKKRQMELASASGRRAGCSSRGQQRQDARGAWQREQKSGDGWHTRGVYCLMVVSHCSTHSDNGNRLTKQV